MSHLPERKEKRCLNCNAALHGRFCHVCGQQNIEPREGFWNMLTHFLFDLFHFDGKFFSTIKLLLFKPGYLSQEHLRGRKADYLHPIRMYIFTSAFFIIILAAILFKEGFGIITNALADTKGRSPELGSWLFGITFFVLGFYWYKSLRRFYKQSRRKTIFKFLVLLCIHFFVFMILFVGFILFSAMTS